MRAGSEHVFPTEAKICRPAVPRRAKADPLQPHGVAQQAAERGLRYAGRGRADDEIDGAFLTESKFTEKNSNICQVKFNFT